MLEQKTPCEPYQWQPIVGCSHYSAGCTNCKTMTLAPKAMREQFLSEGMVRIVDEKPIWTGKVILNESALGEPALRAPSTIFVCPHGDLFHEGVEIAWLDMIFDVMEASQKHAFQIVTKRAARMFAYMMARYEDRAPPRNIAISVSVERQQEADERIPFLQATPARHKFLTIYPLLERIDIVHHLARGGIIAVAVGEEPERPALPEWIDEIERACRTHDITFLSSSELVRGE